MVQQLEDRFGPQEFGQIMQILVALSFKRAGFQVVKNAIGVPDLQAFRGEVPTGFAIEVEDRRIHHLAVEEGPRRRDVEGKDSGGRRLFPLGPDSEMVARGRGVAEGDYIPQIRNLQ